MFHDVRRGLCALALATLCACATPQSNSSRPPLESALESIRGPELLRHITVLASDEFEGRAPATRGEDVTVDYLVGEFKRLGLAPGNPDGTYVQNVPLMGITSAPAISMRVGPQVIDWEFKKDYVGGSALLQPVVEVQDSELVFVGYGVIAPEYGWDDYKDFDVRGKTVLTLTDDPQVPDPADPSRLDRTMFKGAFTTYYGTGRHKREIAAARGAAGRITIHEDDDPAGPFSTYLAGAGREQYELRNARESHLPCGILATEGSVRELLAKAGHDYRALRKAAQRRDFRPVPLGVRLRCEVRNALRQMSSRNVVAKVEGSDPRLRDQYVIYTAHWDHFGRDPNRQGDQIFHGALDNASGVAGLLEIARAYAELRPRPRRSVLFVATTGEERGFFGAKFYAANPLYPLARTVAALNLDVLNPFGATSDFELVPYGESTLDTLIA